MKKVTINTEYITLGQFLKYIGIVHNGAIAKIYLKDKTNPVSVNKQVEQRRGKKLYPNDEVNVNGDIFLIVKGGEDGRQ